MTPSRDELTGCAQVVIVLVVAITVILLGVWLWRMWEG